VSAFLKNRRIESQALLLDLGEFISLLFHIHYPNGVKFGTIILYVMKFNICEFSENRHKEGHTFLMDVTEVALTCILWNSTIFGNKKHLGTACVSRQCVTTGNFVVFCYEDGANKSRILLTSTI
jgi:hypothetical protein